MVRVCTAFFVIFVSQFALAAVDPTSTLLPQPKVTQLTGAAYDFDVHSPITIPTTASAEVKRIAHWLANDLGQLVGGPLQVKTEDAQFDSGGVQRGPIHLKQIEQWSESIGILGWPARDLGPEGYILDVSRHDVTIVATTGQGLFYGSQTLKQLAEIQRGAGTTSLAGLRIVDWPDVEKRMIQYDVGRNNTVNMTYWKRWIRELARLKINQVMFYLEDDYKYNKYPFLGRPKTFTAEKVAELVAYARDHYIDLIPEPEMFGHSERILAYPEFKDLQMGDNPSAWSPCAERTYEVLGNFMKELAPAFNQTDLFHIGSDEVWGLDSDPRCKAILDKGGVELVYANHVMRLKELLKPLQRRTAIWGDILLEKPGILKYIDRDFTIFDWHYEEDKNFPSLKFFQDNGFRDIYATPAVHGYNDVYTALPVSFRNIPGFTKAALEHGIKKVCVTIWEMRWGGNAENYLYGLAYGSQVMWNSPQTSSVDFNRRFAQEWFGIDKAGAATQVDRAFWFPWRISGSGQSQEQDITGYWQDMFTPGRLLYQNLIQSASEQSDEDLRKRFKESIALSNRVQKALPALQWLKKEARRNPMTIVTLETVMKIYQHLARKSLVIDRMALDYRKAFAAQNKDRKKLAKILVNGSKGLAVIAQDLKAIEKRFKFLIDHTNHDPGDEGSMRTLAKEFGETVLNLQKAAKSVQSGAVVPSPESLGLAMASTVLGAR